MIHTVIIRGKNKIWGIDTNISAETADAWRKDGLKVDRNEGSIPKCIGFPVRLWFFIRDAFSK